MTRKEAWDFANAEIAEYGYPVKPANLALPKNPPEDTFYCFFSNGTDTLCRVYMFNRKTVSFVKVMNFNDLKKENPSLVDSYLVNGIFLYRGQEKTPVLKKTGPKTYSIGFQPQFVRSLA